MRRLLLAFAAVVLCLRALPETSAQGRKAVDQGHLLGAADTVKQLYWASRRLRRHAPRHPRAVWNTTRGGRPAGPPTGAASRPRPSPFRCSYPRRSRRRTAGCQETRPRLSLPSHAWPQRPAARAPSSASPTRPFATVIANLVECRPIRPRSSTGSTEPACGGQRHGSRVAGEIRTYAGDPRAAVAALADLGQVTGPVSVLGLDPA